MRKVNNILEFIPSTQVNIIEEPFTANEYLTANRLLYFKGFYRLGNLKTNSGNDVLALKFIPTSMDIWILEPIAGTQEARKVIDTHPHTSVLDNVGMPHNEIVPEYNCHGLCFGDSLYRIPDATAILNDEYDECEENESCCVVYFENNVTVHSAIRKENGTYKAKLGYRKLIDNETSIENAITPEITYDRTVFYKLKNRA